MPTCGWVEWGLGAGCGWLRIQRWSAVVALMGVPNDRRPTIYFQENILPPIASAHDVVHRHKLFGHLVTGVGELFRQGIWKSGDQGARQLFGRTNFRVPEFQSSRFSEPILFVVRRGLLCLDAASQSSALQGVRKFRIEFLSSGFSEPILFVVLAIYCVWMRRRGAPPSNGSENSGLSS